MGAPLCKDCRHIRFPGCYCDRPTSHSRSLVDGSPLDTVDAPAESERYGRFTLFRRREKCGPDARFFERRSAPPGPSK